MSEAFGSKCTCHTLVVDPQAVIRTRTLGHGRYALDLPANYDVAKAVAQHPSFPNVTAVRVGGVVEWRRGYVASNEWRPRVVDREMLRAMMEEAAAAGGVVDMFSCLSSAFLPGEIDDLVLRKLGL